ncbi:restriction endonuclease subunit S [Aliarcobacter skirrowii]|uniref:restriction endonuclease subunit S n=1 Tax=Aliarcobacter skirrowii TaxID=28200 RepID=UPI0014040490|nr:restriction endonuclease subunit S [Aliarcobacter skirrowii]
MKMLNLEDKEWKEFFIKDIFIILKEKSVIQVPTGAYINKEKLKKGITPRITVSSKNNGIDGYYSSTDKNYRTYVNFISVSFLGTVFYHPYEASIDMKVHCLKIIGKELNFYLAQFLVPEIKKNLENASYGNQISSTDLPTKKIILPINKKNEPDFEYMEQYTKLLMKRKLDDYKKYAKKVLVDLEFKEIEPLDNKEWKEFFLTEIFDKIQRGKRLTKSNQKMGSIPYISSTASTNGVDNFISNKNGVRVFSDCLTIANSGSVGASFYHPYDFVASDHITHLKNEELNEFVYLFIATLTNRFSGKYNFNREINDLRISREKILLPINSEDTPDYAYMEQYIINMKHKKIKQYLDYLEKQKKDS